MTDTNQLPPHTITIQDHPEPHIMQWSDLELAAVKRYAEQYALQAIALRSERVPMTERELELIDGMIAVQLDHAQRCDAIDNLVMGEKQKGWDMERVELLRRIRSFGITAKEGTNGEIN